MQGVILCRTLDTLSRGEPQTTGEISKKKKKTVCSGGAGGIWYVQNLEMVKLGADKIWHPF